MENYIKLRKQFEFFFYFGAFVLIITSAALWRNSIFYVVGLIFFLDLLESILVKCPHCGKRPVNLFRRFPQKCSHCGNNL